MVPGVDKDGCNEVEVLDQLKAGELPLLLLARICAPQQSLDELG